MAEPPSPYPQAPNQTPRPIGLGVCCIYWLQTYPIGRCYALSRPNLRGGAGGFGGQSLRSS
ncbi:MAG: hypothetical protein AAFV72_00065 [Cyanobacteria bacterium J06635_1]